MSKVISEKVLNRNAFRSGVLVSYADEDSKSGKALGIIYSIEEERVWGYWQKYRQNSTGKFYFIKAFNEDGRYVNMSELSLEKDWSQIKNFRNIPDIALIKRK